jgi:phospho-N-acetylmuramoyl-pentapeptide-transferase
MHSILIPPLLFALFLGLLMGRPLIAVLRRLKARQVISTDAPQRHQSKAGTPTMGGLLIMAAGVGGVLAAQLWKPELRLLTTEMVAALVVTLAFTAIGLLDDLLIVTRGKNLGLKARQKLALQVLFAAVFVWWWDGRTGEAIDARAAVAGAVHLLLLVGMSNAVNLTDGLDGLAAGVAVPLFLLFGVIGWLGNQLVSAGLESNLGLAAFSMAMAGACLGFLWFNTFPALVFMGDTGALGLGGGMAAMAIMLHAEWALLLAAGVFLAEAASVMLQVASFKSTGKRVFRRSPLHHHFEEIGWPETRIVGRFWIVASALAAWTFYLLAR